MTASAQAQTINLRKTPLPPEEYDHSYEGNLTITRVGNRDKLRELCRRHSVLLYLDALYDVTIALPQLARSSF
jgi:hypothetical protein